MSVRARHTTPAEPADLTLLHWLCAGHSNAQIAARLRRSEKTVRNRLTRLYRRLGVRNRAQAVAVCLGHTNGPCAPSAAPHTTGYRSGHWGDRPGGEWPVGWVQGNIDKER